ncbi:YgjP-like metallopeptidase domain-containing protein [Sphingobacterium spiritivorum]
MIVKYHNFQLTKASKFCIEYVLHELCHLIEPNQSMRFYALLGELL